MKSLSIVAGGLVVALLLSAANALAQSPRAWTEKNLADLVELYKHLHQNPELSLEEEQTGKRIADELRRAGFDVGPPIGGHGVVGILANGEGPRVMVRTDLDALPVTEQTGLVYASKVRITDKQGRDTGVMHACGHDIHMTCFVGAARYLAANKDKWRGSLMFVGQPAEESGSGARRMIADGLFTTYRKPDVALALHCAAQLATGKIGYRPGASLANTDSIDITVYGRGGHGAYPHLTIDPIVQAAHLVIDLQTIVSREIKPTEPAVITVGSIHGGTRYNVIGDRCHLQLTVRSMNDETRQQLRRAIERKAKAVAASCGAPEPKIEHFEGALALHNDPQTVERLLPAFRRAVGEENLVLTEPSMGGEDFSQFGVEGVPVVQFQVGTIEPGRLASFTKVGQAPPSLHSPLYYPDPEPSIAVGTSGMIEGVLELLGATK